MYRKSWFIPLLVLLLCSVTLFSYQKNTHINTYALPLPRTELALSQKPSDFVKVELSWANQHIVAEREGTSWKLTLPTVASADSSYIYDVISTFITPGNIQFVEDCPSDLASYGIHENAPSLRFYDASYNKHEFIQGKLVNNTFYYAYDPDSDTMYSVPKKSFDSVSKDLNTWLNKRYIDFNPASTAHITLSWGDITHRIEPVVIHNTVQFESSTLENAQVAAFIKFLETSKAVSFITSNASPQVASSYGFDESALHIAIVSTDGTSTEFEISRSFANENTCYVLLKPHNTILTIPNIVVPKA